MELGFWETIVNEDFADELWIEHFRMNIFNELMFSEASGYFLLQTGKLC